ncbi:DNA N-6-adenine-methyltransferase [Vibrio phage 1.084.O._10N.261.49.F5]|nr:DNA N-6-adenine-methyltransferase [Vibrio phage 1.084.O._10N.261.49.F5]
MFSSANQAWCTRWTTFNSIQEQLGREYNLDPCCLEETAKCDNFLTPKQDMFTIKNPLQRFEKETEIQMFVNPEYGRNQRKFVEHVADWCEYDNVIADVLIPARTDTALFHDVILPRATGVYFIKGRITFGSNEYWEMLWEKEYLDNGKKNSLYQKHGKMSAAPFPSMIVSFGGDSDFEYGTLKLDKESYD